MNNNENRFVMCSLDEYSDLIRKAYDLMREIDEMKHQAEVLKLQCEINALQDRNNELYIKVYKLEKELGKHECETALAV